MGGSGDWVGGREEGWMDMRDWWVGVGGEGERERRKSEVNGVTFSSSATF